MDDLVEASSRGGSIGARVFSFRRYGLIERVRSILISIAQCPARAMLHIGIRVAMIGLLVSLLRSLVGYFAILIGLFR